MKYNVPYHYEMEKLLEWIDFNSESLTLMQRFLSL